MECVWACLHVCQCVIVKTWSSGEENASWECVLGWEWFVNFGSIRKWILLKEICECMMRILCKLTTQIFNIGTLSPFGHWTTKLWFWTHIFLWFLNFFLDGIYCYERSNKCIIWVLILWYTTCTDDVLTWLLCKPGRIVPYIGKDGI